MKYPIYNLSTFPELYLVIVEGRQENDDYTKDKFMCRTLQEAEDAVKHWIEEYKYVNKDSNPTCEILKLLPDGSFESCVESWFINLLSYHNTLYL